MDLNELFRRHQLALIGVGENEAPDKRVAAEREADRYAAQIDALRATAPGKRSVISVHTYRSLSRTERTAHGTSSQNA
ncbi:hypothetical protein [Alteraurantiacibacter palmitatis]|uniref:Uncharacterized protein n=1 Tax=Alteraurantiacibacter palmitatis TaxID=2054628 RepID=A0ABV7E0L9_9SPHN